MSEINHHFVRTNGIRMHVAEQGEGPLVLLAHGFPESWYSWKHQMAALAAAGYRAVAMDQRGYGQTDKPEAIEAYNIFQLAGDLVGLVQALGEEQAIIVGHDWGAPVSWHAAQLRSDIFRAVVLMSVPFLPLRDASPVPPTQLMSELGGENETFYQLFYQVPDLAEALYEADIAGTLQRGFYGISGKAPAEVRHATIFLNEQGAAVAKRHTPPTLDWLSQDELAFYVAEFQNSGFRGPLNWYRNIDYNWEHTGFLRGSTLQQPFLFIAGELDPVLDMYPDAYETLEERAPNLSQKVLLPNIGHWVQQEAAVEVNERLLDFLSNLDEGAGGTRTPLSTAAAPHHGNHLSGAGI